MTPLRLALTADLHWGIRAAGDAATRRLVAHLQADPPDVLVLAGDVGAGRDFGPCLDLFAHLPGRKALVPGNHDVWVESADERGDSLDLYDRHLPQLCAAHGFHYLDHGPLHLPEAGVSLVGSMNWYDYSWSIDELPQAAPDWQERLAEKRFTRGRHNDARFIRWPYTDSSFTTEVVARLRAHLEAARTATGQAIVVTHHPPFRALNYPVEGPRSLDRLLWEAFSGNRALEELLAHSAAQVPLAFCGHTHRAVAGEHAGICGHNIGGDYHFKRLLTLEWPAGTVTAREFYADDTPPG
jgi:3',5'-cyclic AMP phosphodiesterase CpdA